MLEAFIVG